MIIRIRINGINAAPRDTIKELLKRSRRGSAPVMPTLLSGEMGDYVYAQLEGDDTIRVFQAALVNLDVEHNEVDSLPGGGKLAPAPARPSPDPLATMVEMLLRGYPGSPGGSTRRS